MRQVTTFVGVARTLLRDGLDRHGQGIVRRFQTAPLAEIVGLTALASAFFGFYVFVGFPIYNNATWLDPWYYTGLFVNFKFLYAAFPGAYYSSRLPWIIPGSLANDAFSPSVAYLVLHVLFGLAATGSLYLLLRRFFGRAAAIVGSAAAAASPVYYHALYRDYVNTGELTYLLVAAYFGLAARDGTRPRLAMGLSGFFLMAAVATHLYAGIFAVALLIPYVILFRPRPYVVARDAIGFLLGAAGLFLLCGLYAMAYGRAFDFIRPQFDALSQFNSASYKRSGYMWLLSEPRVVVPFFLVGVTALAASGRRSASSGRGGRAAIALGAYLVTLYAFVLIWEFGSSGILIEWLDYFEIFFSMAVLPFVGVAAWSLMGITPEPAVAASVVVALVGLALPPLLIYRFGWTGEDGQRAMVPSVVLMLAVLALVAIVARPSVAQRGMRTAAAILAAGGLGLGVAYPVAASRDIVSNMNYSSRTNAVDTGIFHAGIDWARWMARDHLQRRDMVTWYDDAKTPDFTGIASIYYFGWILQDGNMPTVTRQFREQWRARKPTEIVLLCAHPFCEDAPAALRRAGYAVHEKATHVFVSGPVRLWVRVLGVAPG